MNLRFKLIYLITFSTVALALSGCATGGGSGGGSSSDGSAKGSAITNHFYSKDFLVIDKLKVISQAKLIGQDKEKGEINLDLLFSNSSQQRIDIQLDLVKYMTSEENSETFFAGPKTIALLPDSVEKLQLKNLNINMSDEVKLVFIYSYLDNRRMMEVDLKRLTKDEYKEVKF